MTTFIMPHSNAPMRLTQHALDLHPEFSAAADAAIERETEGDVVKAVHSHWLLLDSANVRMLNDLVRSIRKASLAMGQPENRSDERLIYLMLKDGRLLDRPQPTTWIASSKATLDFFKMFGRVKFRSNRAELAGPLRSDDDT